MAEIFISKNSDGTLMQAKKILYWLLPINKECVFSCYSVLSCRSFVSNKNEPPRDKTNKMACAPSEDSG